ncbi:hypothetical protein [Streptomyces sp. NPDC004266]|uniref:hypothetical protein n=1 Tax=Streptomyces sp. NPDC004266 TaxID=3364693 RepID=UPI00368D8401
MTFLPSRRPAPRSFAGIGAVVVGSAACGPSGTGPAGAAKGSGRTTGGGGIPCSPHDQSGKPAA